MTDVTGDLEFPLDPDAPLVMWSPYTGFVETELTLRKLDESLREKE